MQCPDPNPLIGGAAPSREQLIHSLYEAAELEHNLMCTYLYAAYSLRQGTEEGLSAAEAEAVARWQRCIVEVAIEEMGHLAAVWNITSALGGAPRFGRNNFPLDPGYLPARITVKLAPFSAATLQHFIFLERPAGSDEPEGEGFEPERLFVRGSTAPRLTPMATDYDTVGAFYAALEAGLSALAEAEGEAAAFCGDPALQLSPAELDLAGARPVRCLASALAALHEIVAQGEGAPSAQLGSHFQRFVGIRGELAALRAINPAFEPAHPAATNPVLRRPPRPQGRVWIENEAAVQTVDVANAGYGLMLRLLASAYALRGPAPEKALLVDLALGLMRAVVPLAQHAARLPAGPANPGCHAGMSFTALRDAASLPAGASTHRFVVERLAQVAGAADALAQSQPSARPQAAARQLQALAQRAAREFERLAAAVPAPSAAPVSPAPAAAAPVPVSVTVDGVESVEGQALTLHFEARRCIHARFCVTGAPQVFLANTPGAWIFPDAMPVERLVEIAHACPSGAIRYQRKDGAADEAPPPVNLASVRENGPYAIRGELVLEGRSAGTRATLCRCGASRNKPFCDGSHVAAGFSASGEPATGLNGSNTDMLPLRNGRLAIDPQPDGPLAVRGNLEVLSGTGRMVCRVTQARLCRCGGSASKPFCDGSHARIGFKSD
jgi:CDGSH-type Zn-finger protein/uncharacterized Fe-S cluster protein YjdI